MGIQTVPLNTGATVLTAPVTEAAASWLWYQVVHIGYEEMVTDVVAVQGIQFARIQVDGKAMRRLKNDSEIQFVATNSTVNGAATVNIAGGIRLLAGTK